MIEDNDDNDDSKIENDNKMKSLILRYFKDLCHFT